jgi:hypothetical protein
MSQKIAKYCKLSQKIAGQQPAASSLPQPTGPALRPELARPRPTTNHPRPPFLNSSNIPRTSSSSFGCKLLIAKWWILGRRFFLLETDEEAEATDLMSIKCQQC